VGEQAPTLGELMLGVEGLAMLRLLYADAADERAARVAEVRDVLDRIDHDPATAATVGSEYGVADGYARWLATSEVPKPSVMARFGTASTAGASVATSSTALMIKLASRWAGQTGPPV